MKKFTKLLPLIAVFMLSANVLTAEETEKPEITEEFSLSSSNEDLDAPVVTDDISEETEISEE